MFNENSDPIQSVEQEILADATTEVEQINQEVPSTALIPWEKKNELAGQIWLDSGGIENDPLTLENWLKAETILLSQTEPTYNG